MYVHRDNWSGQDYSADAYSPLLCDTYIMWWTGLCEKETISQSAKSKNQPMQYIATANMLADVFVMCLFPAEN